MLFHYMLSLLNTYAIIIYLLKGFQVKKFSTRIKDRTKWERSELLIMFITKCQDANSIAMYGLSKSFTIKYPFRKPYSEILNFSFQYSESVFCNIKNFLFIL